jgi:hypothetical protein
MQQLAQHVTMKRQVRRIAGLVDYRKNPSFARGGRATFGTLRDCFFRP